MWKVWVVMAALFVVGAVPTFAPCILTLQHTESPSGHSSVRIEQHETPSPQVDGTEYWPVILGLKLKITDSLLAFFTLLLVVANLFLWYATKKLWEAGERQAAFTQQQLQLANNEFNYVNRPRVTVRRARVRFDPKGNGVNFVLVNLGHLPATNIECLINIRVVDNHDVEAFLKESMPRYESVSPIKYADLGGDQRTFIFVVSDQINHSTMRSVRGLKSTLFFYGLISFKGPDNAGRTSAFFAKYRPLTRRFHRMKDRDYDYY
jgi:hypothetical protein